MGCAYAACLTLFVLANRLTTAANTIFLQSTAPLYVLILAPWLLKEPTRRHDLVFMAAVFFTARHFEPAYPWLGYVKAFAEAAMVGGLADWFAVTALFRHPLGLPIPHTAIIPRNKDRIGEALASFLKENFLIAAVVARRMRNIDIAGAAGRFLRAPEGEGTRIRHGASRLIADIFEGLDDERLGGIVKGAIASRIRAMEVSPLLGHALASAINEDRHVPMLEAAIRWMARTLDSNEPLIREMVKKRANWVLKLAGLDTKLADSIMDGLRKLTVEMSTDPAHPVRRKIEEALAQLANDLQTKPETRERVERAKRDSPKPIATLPPRNSAGLRCASSLTSCSISSPLLSRRSREKPESDWAMSCT